jgi:hypothetical protein
LSADQNPKISQPIRVSHSENLTNENFLFRRGADRHVHCPLDRMANPEQEGLPAGLSSEVLGRSNVLPLTLSYSSKINGYLYLQRIRKAT